MQHAAARQALAHCLSGESFGAGALTATLSAALTSAPPFAMLAANWLDACSGLPVDASDTEAPSLAKPLPDDPAGLVNQLAPFIIANPIDIGMDLAALHAVIELWPHAAREERLKLRRLWLNGIAQRCGKPGSSVSTDLLREWNRNLPTLVSTTDASLNALIELLDEPTAEGAYRLLAQALTPTTDFATLARVIGTVAEHVMQRRFDRGGLLQRCLLGTIALEHLTGLMAPHRTATIIHQLVHTIWWCGQHLRPLSPGGHHPTLTEAVLQGDATAAQGAARQLAHEAASLWDESGVIVEHTIANDNPAWPRSVFAVYHAWRRSGHEAIGPDDAATLGAALAAVGYLNRSSQAPA